MSEKITKTMKINEIFDKNPEKSPDLAKALSEIGLGCIGCAAASFESLEEGLIAHGFNDEQINEIIEKLNKIIE